MARKVDHEQRRQEIAERALRLFSQVGYDNVSLIMIAAATGISRTVLYRYFCSKREIMDAAILTVTGEIEAETRKILTLRIRPIEKLERTCHAVVEVMFRHRAFVIAVFDFVIGMVRTGADMTAGIHRFTAGTRETIGLLITHAKNAGELPEILVVDRITDALYAEFESCAMRIVLGTESDASAARIRFSDIVRALSIWK